MSDTDRGQLSASAAEVYDAFFVPALFEQWTEVVLDVGDVRSRHRVLDVGCGTGVLARAAHVRVGGHGHVAGVDPNDGMLTVARRAGPDIEWQPGLAEQLPCEPSDARNRDLGPLLSAPSPRGVPNADRAQGTVLEAN